jgi:DNA-binding beta-propeller fold protein YncE
MRKAAKPPSILHPPSSILYPLSSILLLLAGCSKPGVIFPPLNPPLVWPAPPEPTRIRYVGQLSTDADLKPATNFGEAIGRAIFGKADTHSMLSPLAVCTDGADRVFVADSNAQLIHVFNLNTRRYEQWTPGKPDEGKRFSQPVALAWDPAGRLLVADSAASRLYAFDGAGNFLGPFGPESLQHPCGIAIDTKGNRIFVADSKLHQVLVLSPMGALLTTIGQRGMALGEFNYPTFLAMDSQGRLYVSDSLNFRIQVFAPDLHPLRAMGKKGDMPGYFSEPKGIAIDSQDHLYVVDANFESVQIFDDKGALLLDFGQEGQRPGEFWLPVGIFIDLHNRIWIADSYNRRVQAFDFVPENRP